MEYREKHNLSQSMQDNSCIEADRMLLQRMDPENILIHRIGINDTLSFELVYALLGYVSQEEILENRKVFKAKKTTGTTQKGNRKNSAAGKASKSSGKADKTNKPVDTSVPDKNEASRTGETLISKEKTEITEKKS